jgi:NifU-like protein involved in Fe-S cluster formation
MKLYIALMLMLFLVGCGADVASTAATVAAAKAKEAEEAQKTKEQIVNQINDALAAGQQRLNDADAAAK